MNAAEVAIEFRPLQAADEPLLRQWLVAPHVTEWWRDPEAELRDALAHVATGDAEAFVIRGNGHDIGYIHAYDAREDSYFADRAPGTKGMDLYLGYKDLVGRGLGRRVIAAFADRLLAAGAPAVVADPETKNSAAVAAYRHAGFRLYRVHCGAAPGNLILMSKTAPETSQVS